jgi:hypothetical protein
MEHKVKTIKRGSLSGTTILMLVAILGACADTAGMGGESTNLQVVDTAKLNLGLASTFAVFGGAAGITSAGTGTVIIGDMGTTGASTMVTGFHNSAFSYTETPLNVGVVTGTIYTDAPQGNVASIAIANATAEDMLTAFDHIAAIPDGIDPGAGQLGGLTLAPGVYKSESGAFAITGQDLTLDAQDDPSAVWIFQMASSLTVGGPAAPRSVLLVNGAQSRNVYWQVGSAATVNGAGGGTMVGTIISSAAITFSTAGNTTITTLNGRALALNASVTMVNTVVNVYGEAVPVLPVTPDPVTPHLLLSGTAGGGAEPYDVAAVITLGGYINVENNGGHVAATITGAGTIDITNDGGLVTATQTGNGVMTIGNTNPGTLTITNTGNGNTTIANTGAGALTLTNTGNGQVAITNSAVGAVTVTNTGDGGVTVNADGAFAYTYTHTGSDAVSVLCADGVCN